MKKAFVFGSNYKGTDAELSACVSDCERIRDRFKSRGYHVEEYIQETVLSWRDIKPKLVAFIKSLNRGNVGVVYYSGHGFQLPDVNGDEKDGKDEAIYFSKGDWVGDDELRQIFQQAKLGVNLFLMFDCCHSGTMADLPLRLDNLKVVRENNFRFRANVLSISGCADPNLSYENSKSGFLTEAFLQVFEKWTPKVHTTRQWVDLFVQISSHLVKASGGVQKPALAFNSLATLRKVWL